MGRPELLPGSRPLSGGDHDWNKIVVAPADVEMQVANATDDDLPRLAWRREMFLHFCTVLSGGAA